MLVHVSGEDGDGWTCLAIDRSTRAWSVAQGQTQRTSTDAAYRALYS